MKLREYRLPGWRLGCWIGLFVCWLPTLGAVTPQVVYSVDSIAALRLLSSGTYQSVTVTGYSQPRDGGGGFYAVDPSDTTSADNGGTIIVASDSARWKLCQAEPPAIQQFGAVNGAGSDNSGAINDALLACSAVRVPPGVYRCDHHITLQDYNVLVGEGSHGEASDASLTGAPKFVFFGGSSGEACITSDTTTSLLDAAIYNLAITTDSTANYDWLIELMQPVGVDLKNIRAETTNLSTGGIQCVKLTTCSGPSWVNHWYNVQVNLPAYAGSGTPPAATKSSLEVEISDSQIVGGYFIGGTGAVFHGSGIANCSNVRFEGSVGYAVTLLHDENSTNPTAGGFINCTFADPYLGAVEIDGGTLVPNSSPRFVGNTFVTPGVAGPLVSYASSIVQTRGGLFLDNTFISNPAGVFSLNGGVGWTLAHNKYSTAPDFSAVTAATIDEDTHALAPNAVLGHGSLVIGQAAGPSLGTVTGSTSETPLATVSIPANALSLNGKLRVSATFAVTGTSSKTARIKFGTGAAAQSFYTGPVSGSTTLIHAQCEISMAADSTGSEVGAQGLADPGPGIDGSAVRTAGVNGTIVQSVLLTGQLTAPADSIALQQYTVEVVVP